MSGTIDTDDMSTRLRAKAVRPDSRELLISNLQGTGQDKDLTVAPICEGFARIRHFYRKTSEGWPLNPLPVEPALRRLGLPMQDSIKAVLFQNAACNWRCWYCFVPFKLLDANERHGSWLTADRLVDLYLEAGSPAPMIDLSGGQPELTPEWVPWMMDALERRGLSKKVYLWSDDNLSNGYFWEFLSPAEIKRVREYEMYGKVGCFKGFDGRSFAFNTRAAPQIFERQFALFKRYLSLGIDMYAYATFTAPDALNIEARIKRFVDDLQRVHPLLPLRTIPLRIHAYGVVEERSFHQQPQAMTSQEAAISVWNQELSDRFTADERSRSIVDVSFR